MKVVFACLAICFWLSANRAEASCAPPSVDQLIKLSGHPFAVRATSDNCHLFVSYQSSSSGELAVINNEGGTFRVVRTVVLPGKIGGGLSLSHDGQRLAVATFDKVILFDAERLIEGNPNPLAAVIDEAGKGAINTQFSKLDDFLFVSEEQNAAILVVNLQAMINNDKRRAILGRTPVGNGPVGLALAPDGEHLFATSETMGGPGPCPAEAGGGSRAEGALFVIDAVKAVLDPRHAVIRGVSAGCSPVRVVISPDGHELWLSERASNRVLGMDPAPLISGKRQMPMTSIAVGTSPIGIAIRPDGTQLWVGNSDRFGSTAGSLTVIAPADPAAARVDDTLGVGHFPRDLEFLPDGKTLAIALYGDDALGIHVTAGAAAP